MELIAHLADCKKVQNLAAKVLLVVVLILPLAPRPTQAASNGARLKASGFTLPPTPAPGGAYLSARKEGALVYVSAQLPYNSRGTLGATCKGVQPDARTMEKAIVDATLNLVAAAGSAAGDVNRIRGVLDIELQFACGAGDMNTLADHASRTLVRVFGTEGRHARTISRVAALPEDAAVAIRGTFLAP